MVYLVDTDVISESRKASKANTGVRNFFKQATVDGTPIYISAITVGELRRGMELIRYRGDLKQANSLEAWLDQLLSDYGDLVLKIDAEVAQLWGRLRVPHHENALDKFIAATALIYDLTVVTRNKPHFQDSGVRILNPFT